MAKVAFHSADKIIRLNRKKDLKSFLEFLFQKEDRKLEQVDYIFCSDDYLLEINKKFLNHDTYTDIITFDLSEDTAVIGEVYISTERVKENAAKFQTTIYKELLRVVFHGALHLCGYGDKKKSEITTMREKEEYYLRLFDEKLNGS